ncbi:MAG: hypothetical protein IPL15_06475 [Comamonadaceae bacterium]|uniref:hypothetical protein n=1 Tax=Candidatus Skiveiella danica TaxID=3386177 RepID=UPI00390950E8|nr:hypothetical protein [Comamonadaceae bacterium]
MRLKTLLRTFGAWWKGRGDPAGAARSAERRWSGTYERRSLVAALGVPADVIPLSCWHTASLVWTSGSAPSRTAPARSWGWSRPEEAPQYSDGLQAQMDVAQAILHRTAATPAPTRSCRVPPAPPTSTLACKAATTMQKIATAPARFAVMADKRVASTSALDHLIAQAPLASPRGPRPTRCRRPPSFRLGHRGQGTAARHA